MITLDSPFEVEFVETLTIGHFSTLGYHLHATMDQFSRCSVTFGGGGEGQNDYTS